MEVGRKMEVYIILLSYSGRAVVVVIVIVIIYYLLSAASFTYLLPSTDQSDTRVLVLNLEAWDEGREG